MRSNWFSIRTQAPPAVFLHSISARKGPMLVSWASSSSSMPNVSARTARFSSSASHGVKCWASVFQVLRRSTRSRRPSFGILVTSLQSRTRLRIRAVLSQDRTFRFTANAQEVQRR